MIASNGWIAPEDYKVYCFNGEPKFIMVCVGREKGGHPKFYFFDEKWQLARINRDSKNAPLNFTIDKPECFDKLITCARTLSKNFPFVRADFYIVGSEVYFGELTFSPAHCVFPYLSNKFDLEMGKLLQI